MIRGKKINFFIGYLNEDVFILLNTCNYMGLFVKVSPKGDKTNYCILTEDDDIEEDDLIRDYVIEDDNDTGETCSQE